MTSSSGSTVREPRRRPARRRPLTALAVAAVVLATLLGGFLALNGFGQNRTLSVGTIALSVEAPRSGALDLYVPLVDWGARFPNVRLPARLHVDLRSVDRTVVERVARGGHFDVATVRDEVRDAIAGYLRALLAVTLLGALALGALTAFAVRGRGAPRLRVMLAAAGATALAGTVAVALLLPPRGTLDAPEYYAYGPDIPRALDAIAAVQRSTQTLDQELDAQLVGLARLVSDPAGRPPLENRPRLIIASDLHNNVLALPLLRRTTGESPLLFAGDLTDRGSPLETSLVREIVGIGHPFVFVSGNHDSDTLVRELVRDGAIVLTQHGRLLRGGRLGPPIVEVAGLRVAGYADPYERRARDDFADRYEEPPDPSEQAAFAAWLDAIRDDVDVVMVHEPDLAEQALAELEADPPPRPLLIVTGHTHRPALHRQPGVTMINGGSIGAGGTGNLAEGGDLGVARLLYEPAPEFRPLAADLVEIDPGSGSATASRTRLDVPPETADVE